MSDNSVWPQPKHAPDSPDAPEVDATTEQLDLLEDPFADDLDKRLKSAAPLRLANRATYVLVALVIGVAGFVAGAQVQKSYGTTSASPSGTFPTALPSGLAGGGFANRGGGNAGNAGGGGRAITGTVKLVDGTTVYVEQADGTVITVKTSDSTSVLAPSTLKDLKAGATVTVQGQNDNGTVTATSITQGK
jgi:hypothetical protein